MTRNKPALQAHASADQLTDLAYRVETDLENSSVWRHVRACPLCEGRFKGVVAERERGRVSWEGLKQEDPGDMPSRGSSRVWPTLGALAAALAVASLALLLKGPAHIEPVHLSQPGSALVLRSQELSDSGQLAAGLEAYGRQDMDRTVELLTPEQSSPGRDLVRRIYLGSALVLRGESRKGLEVLDRVDADALPAPWGDEVRWTRAAAHEELGETERARDILDSLARGHGPFRDKAREILGDD